MATKPMKTLTLPGLDDTYTFLQDDTTLTVPGAAADAKVTGDRLTAIEEYGDEIAKLKNVYTPNLVNPDEIETGKVLNQYGTLNDNATYDTCGFIRVRAGQKYTFSPAIRSYATYDVNKGFIAIYASGVDTGKPYTITADTDGYIRASYRHTTIAEAQAEVGATRTAYVPYGLKVQVELDELESELSPLLVKTKNLVNPATATEGKIISNTGGLQDDSKYVTTALIRVEAGKSYTFSPMIRMYALYDDSTTFIEKYAESSVNTGHPYTITVSADGYIRATYFIVQKAAMQMEEGAESTPFVPYGLAIEASVQETVDAVHDSDVLYGKKWAVCGDSFTAGADSGTLTSGKYAGHKIVYPYIIGNRTGIDVLNFFLNGRTLAFPAVPGEFVNSLTAPDQDWNYQNIPADADYITIQLGINDRHHAPGGSDDDDGEDTTGEIPLGTITDNTTATYYGAWNVVLTWLITNRPFAHIGIIVTNGASQAYRAAQIAIARKYGIPYIDLNGDDRTPCMIRSVNADIDSTVRDAITAKQRVSDSNTHPNNAAHEYESTFIEAFLRSL